MNTSKSLDELIRYYFFDNQAVTELDDLEMHLLAEGKQAIVEAVEGIYGDSDGLREFAGLNLIKPVPKVPSKRRRTTMDTVQQGPAPEKDNLIVHVAKVLREDISISHKSTDVSLRQPPVYEDDHDSWGGYEKLEDWYYVAYSVIAAIDRPKADAALTDLVATDKEPK